MKKTLILITIMMFSISSFACRQTEEAYIYNGETEINENERSFELEDIPQNRAEETVINDFMYSIIGDFDSLSKFVADTKTNNISLKNQEEQFNGGIYMQSYTIHKISTLSEREYSQEKLENGEHNPFYFYRWKEYVERHNLKEYEIINVKFTKSIQRNPLN